MPTYSLELLWKCTKYSCDSCGAVSCFMKPREDEIRCGKRQGYIDHIDQSSLLRMQHGDHWYTIHDYMYTVYADASSLCWCYKMLKGQKLVHIGSSLIAAHRWHRCGTDVIVFFLQILGATWPLSLPLPYIAMSPWNFPRPCRRDFLWLVVLEPFFTEQVHGIIVPEARERSLWSDEPWCYMMFLGLWYMRTWSQDRCFPQQRMVSPFWWCYPKGIGHSHKWQVRLYTWYRLN